LYPEVKRAKGKVDDKNVVLLWAILTKNENNDMLALGTRHDKIMIACKFMVQVEEKPLPVYCSLTRK
jgi:hypothetical protein